jgi:hypothetical protein
VNVLSPCAANQGRGLFAGMLRASACAPHVNVDANAVVEGASIRMVRMAIPD